MSHSVCAGLSHEQLSQLRSMLKEDGIGRQGHSRSASDNARALLHVSVHQQYGLSYDAAVKAAAQAELASPSTIRSAARQFSTTGSLPAPSSAHRGSGNFQHPRHITNSRLTLEGELLLHQLLQDVRENGYCSL